VGCLSRFALNELLELDKIQILSVADLPTLRRPLYLLENKKSLHSEAYNKFIDFAFNYRFNSVT
jgi:DNA-binding transcriptional LysR family regulator